MHESPGKVGYHPGPDKRPVSRARSTVAAFQLRNNMAKKRIVFNLGIFGIHGIDRAATDLINHIPLHEYEIVLHQLYDRPERSDLFDQLPA